MTDRPNTPNSLPSIRRYLLARIVGITLFSFAAFAAAAYFVILRPMQEELARAEMARAAGEVEGRVRFLITEKEQLLALLRDWSRSGVVDLGSTQEAARLLIPVLREQSQVSLISFADQKGRALFFGREPDGSWLLRLCNVEQWGSRQHWYHLNDDASLASEEWVEQYFDARTRPWFKGAIALPSEEGIYWTAPYEHFHRKEAGLTVAARWTHRDTGAQTVVAVDLLLYDLSKATSRIAVGRHGRAAILWGDGRILGVPRHPLVATDQDIRARLLKTPREAGFKMLDAALTRWIADGRPAGKAEFFLAGGETWIGRFRELPLRNQTLLLAAVAPRSDFALGTVWDALAIGAMITAVLGVAFLLGRRFSRRFAEIVDALVSESDRIGALQLDTPVRIDAETREVARLVAAQEQMRGMLLDATRGLEAKVEERTRDLAGLAQEQELLLESVQVGILFTGDTKMLRVNPKFAEIFGYGNPAELTGADTRILFSDEAEFRRFGAEAGPALAAGKPLDIEWWGVRRDGSTFLGHTVAQAIKVPGYRLATIWIVEDVTERRAFERALKEALDQQNAIFRASPYGIAVFEERCFVASSPSFERLLGYGPGEVIGRRARILFGSDDEFERVGHEVYSATGQGKTHSYETRLVRKDGSRF
ncbi:MAG: PAS domain S-box protein [Burkholderiales bacterium]